MKDRKSENRIQSGNTIGMFDLSKGLLMVFVVLGHSVTLFVKYWEQERTVSWVMIPFVVFSVLIYGLIPMFFMMSGYGFRKQRMKRCIQDRIRYLLKPYLWVAAAVTAVAVGKAMLQGNSVIEALRYQSVPFLLGLCPGETEVFGWYAASIGPMWFLLALGGSWIVLNVIFRLENEVLRVICLVTLAAVCTALPFYALIPFCAIQSLSCAGYLFIGYCMKKKSLLFRNDMKQTYIVLIVILVCIMPFGNAEVSQNVWKLGFLDYVASGIAGFLLCKLSVFGERFEGVIAKGVRVLGRNSLYILCVHTVEYLTFPWERIAEMFEGKTVLGILVVAVARAAVIGIGCFGVKTIVKAVKGLGKRKAKG